MHFLRFSICNNDPVYSSFIQVILFLLKLLRFLQLGQIVLFLIIMPKIYGIAAPVNSIKRNQLYRLGYYIILTTQKSQLLSFFPDNSSRYFPDIPYKSRHIYHWIIFHSNSRTCRSEIIFR